MELPSCTVVVATFNRSSVLLRLLKALEAQDVGPDAFEVVVVDDGSSDDTWERLGALNPPYRLVRLHQENQGPAVARNTGITAATGDVIVTLDDDMVPAPDLLRRHAKAHASEPDIVAIGVMAHQASSRLSPWSEWELVQLQRQYDAMLQGLYQPTARQFYTANASVRRRYYIDAGLFDPAFRRSEDVELALRFADMGLQFRFLSEAIAFHTPDRTLKGWKHMAWSFGYYDVEMARNGRQVIFGVMKLTLRTGKPLLRLAVQNLAGRRLLLSAFTSASAAAGVALSFLGFKSAARSAFSLIFNLLYWQGVCDALGGREAFLADLRRPDPAAKLPAGEPATGANV